MAKRKKRSKSKPKLQWLKEMNWANVRRGSLAMLWLLAITAAAFGASYAVPRLETRIAGDAQLEQIEIVFMDSPAWVSAELQTYLISVIEPVLTDDPFHRDELVQIRNKLLNTGWFESIAQVRRTRIDRIEITGEFVAPYAFIRDSDGNHLVDSRGVLLPDPIDLPQASQMLVVTGSRFPRPGRVGMQWEGADITAALSLIGLIQSQPWREQITQIDITGAIRGEPMRLVTDRGTRITWGSSPGEEEALEALADRKLYYLGYLYREYDRVDMGHAGEIDITSTTSIDQRE